MRSSRHCMHTSCENMCPTMVTCWCDRGVKAECCKCPLSTMQQLDGQMPHEWDNTWWQLRFYVVIGLIYCVLHRVEFSGQRRHRGAKKLSYVGNGRTYRRPSGCISCPGHFCLKAHLQWITLGMELLLLCCWGGRSSLVKLGLENDPQPGQISHPGISVCPGHIPHQNKNVITCACCCDSLLFFHIYFT